MSGELASAQKTYDDAYDAWFQAWAASKEYAKKRDEANLALTQAKLQAAGIIPLKTRVNYTGYWRESGPFLVETVTSSGSVFLCKIKKDGTPSKAGTGIYGAVSVDNLEIIQ